MWMQFGSSRESGHKHVARPQLHKGGASCILTGCWALAEHRARVVSPSSPPCTLR
eukprot:NODE_9249_length_377_cov_12.972561_g8348_i0.p3 GENE.NODE_9249_length_377_cov_12.972561_g8348_i0~~NODE_9249_length_377_cov_12.972561_g8348_i0.p3  ORF type:complete len:55 (+),score=0.70 NODE_9249_length_377_cov_12.972561_g8348_i0:210-374(+)